MGGLVEDDTEKPSWDKQEGGELLGKLSPTNLLVEMYY